MLEILRNYGLEMSRFYLRGMNESNFWSSESCRCGRVGGSDSYTITEVFF